MRIRNLESIQTYLFHITSPDRQRISFRMAASNDVLPYKIKYNIIKILLSLSKFKKLVLPLPLRPTITVNFPVFVQFAKMISKYIFK